METDFKFSLVLSYIYVFAKHHFLQSACLHYLADITSFLDDLLALRTQKIKPYTSHLDEK